MVSGFRGCHPSVNILFFASVIIFTMLFIHPACLLLSLLSSLAYYIRLKDRMAARLFFLFLLPALLVVTAINGLFSHNGVTPLAALPNGNVITLEAVVYGLVTGVTVITVILWFFCYNEVVTTDKFIHIFGRRLPAAALVISMALRFVPMYRERLAVIADAQHGVGKDYKTGNIFNRIRNAGHILSVLITWALENAVETSDSMRSRGYGLKGRTSYARFEWQKRDVLLLADLVVLDAVIAAGGFAGTVHCQYDPYIVISPASGFGAVMLFAYALICCLPLAVDLKEEIKWNSLQLKV